MYGISGTSGAGALGASTFGGATTLAATGIESFWVAVTGLTLVMGGILVTRLVPKKEF